MCEDIGEDAYFGFGFGFGFIKDDHTLNFSRKLKHFHINHPKTCSCRTVMCHWNTGKFSAMGGFQDQIAQSPEQQSDLPLL